MNFANCNDKSPDVDPEEYFAGPFKVEWHKIWQEGRLANEQGQKREDNPHKLKVWKEVWGYGWDNYSPMLSNMTMPHLMNCGHMPDGWCLICVKELWDELEAKVCSSEN